MNNEYWIYCKYWKFCTHRGVICSLSATMQHGMINAFREKKKKSHSNERTHSNNCSKLMVRLIAVHRVHLYIHTYTSIYFILHMCSKMYWNLFILIVMHCGLPILYWFKFYIIPTISNEYQIQFDERFSVFVLFSNCDCFFETLFSINYNLFGSTVSDLYSGGIVHIEIYFHSHIGDSMLLILTAILMRFQWMFYVR